MKKIKKTYFEIMNIFCSEIFLTRERFFLWIKRKIFSGSGKNRIIYFFIRSKKKKKKTKKNIVLRKTNLLCPVFASKIFRLPKISHPSKKTKTIP